MSQSVAQHFPYGQKRVSVVVEEFDPKKEVFRKTTYLFPAMYVPVIEVNPDWDTTINDGLGFPVRVIPAGRADVQITGEAFRGKSNDFCTVTIEETPRECPADC